MNTTGDMPQISNSLRAMNCYAGDGTQLGEARLVGENVVAGWLGSLDPSLPHAVMVARAAMKEHELRAAFRPRQHEFREEQQQTNEDDDMNNNRRIVKVYVADPHPSVPIEKALLFEGEEKMTDSTDQELFFLIPLQQKLEAHNAERVKMVDKEQSQRFGKEIFLEPAKIRDLRMVVVEVAKF